MSNRTFKLRLTIDNGVRRVYAVRPAASADLSTPFVAGFRLHVLGDDPAPGTFYLVRLSADGAVNCSCPQWQQTERCKHADCLASAAFLPVSLVEHIRSLTGLLDIAEGKLAECDILSKPASARVPRPRRRRSCKPLAA